MWHKARVMKKTVVNIVLITKWIELNTINITKNVSIYCIFDVQYKKIIILKIRKIDMKNKYKCFA